MRVMKTGGHGNPDIPFGHDCVLDRRPQTVNPVPDMQDKLSDREKKVFESLKKISRDSLWNDAIQVVVSSGDTERFRKLIIQLQSQAADNREVMRRILGHAYGPVMKLKINSQAKCLGSSEMRAHTSERH